MSRKNICSEAEHNLGIKTEQELMPLIYKFFKDNKFYKLNRYNAFDLYNHLLELYIEIKGRNIESKKYNTTFIPNKKIQILKQMLKKNENLTFYFIFKFTDAIKYIKYNADIFKTFNIKKTYLRHRNCYIENLEIPINMLIDMV